MFRRVLCNLSIDIVPNPFNNVQIRWRTKPRWKPIAKSRMFKVPPRRKYPADEEDEVKRLFNCYRTEMKSLRLYFSQRTKAMSTGEDVLAEKQRVEMAAHEEALKVNDEWNAQIAVHREKTLSTEREREAEEILEAVEKAKAGALELKMKAEEIVRQEKERSKTYITPENIDEAINKALDNPVDFEFAIDLQENVIHGRRTKPPSKRDERERAAAVA